jgi:hypothetical protein
MSLPLPIIVDLFDIEYKASRVALDHLADVVEDAGFRASKIDDYDIKIWISFDSELHTDLCGELIIDRMSRTFEISARDDSVTYTAVVTKDFSVIEKFLALLKADLDDRVV